VISLESELVWGSREPLYVAAAALDFLHMTAIERLRRLAYERESLTFLVALPDIPASDLDEAVRRREPLLREVYLDVVKEREALPVDDQMRWLPPPIAIPLSMFRSEVAAPKRFMAATALIEAFFKLSALLAVAPCVGSSPSERRKSAAKSLGQTSPLMLGHTTSVVWERLSTLSNLMPATMAVLAQQRTNVERFIEWRNDDAHSLPSSDATYAERRLSIEPVFKDIVGALSLDWKELAIFVVLETDFTEDGHVAYRLRELRDAQIFSPVVRLLTNKQFMKGRVYLRHGSDLFTDLEPLLSYRACPTCEFEEVFLLDKPHPTQPFWRSSRGHKVQ
jgi:hypothetical protein